MFGVARAASILDVTKKYKWNGPSSNKQCIALLGDGSCAVTIGLPSRGTAVSGAVEHGAK